MISFYHDTPKQTKIYVDGFRVDTIETPKDLSILKELAMTKKVKELLDRRAVTSIVAVPQINPKFIIITTEIDSE